MLWHPLSPFLHFCGFSVSNGFCLSIRSGWKFARQKNLVQLNHTNDKPLTLNNTCSKLVCSICHATQTKQRWRSQIQKNCDTDRQQIRAERQKQKWKKIAKKIDAHFASTKCPRKKRDWLEKKSEDEEWEKIIQIIEMRGRTVGQFVFIFGVFENFNPLVKNERVEDPLPHPRSFGLTFWQLFNTLFVAYLGLVNRNYKLLQCSALLLFFLKLIFLFFRLSNCSTPAIFGLILFQKNGK